MSYRKFNPRANRLGTPQNRLAEAQIGDISTDTGRHQEEMRTTDRQLSPLSPLSPAHTGETEKAATAQYIYKTKHEHNNNNYKGNTTLGCHTTPVSKKVSSAAGYGESGESGESLGGHILAPMGVKNPSTEADLLSPPPCEQAFWSWLVDGAPDETDGAGEWRDDYRKAINKFAVGDTLAHARICAWSKLQGEWHRQHGKKFGPDVCAGCGGAIVGRDFVEPNKGEFCHSHGSGDEAMACLAKYAADWRGAADIGLRALGLIEPPQEPVAMSS